MKMPVMSRDVALNGNNAYHRAGSAHKRHGSSTDRRYITAAMICVSIITALVTVVITSAVINAATNGNGIGTKTDPVVTLAQDNDSGSSIKKSSPTTTHTYVGNDTNADDASTAQTGGDALQQPSTNSSTSDGQPQDASKDGKTGTDSDKSQGNSGQGTSQGGNSSSSGSGTATSRGNNSGTDATDTGSGATDTKGSGANGGTSSGSDASSGSKTDEGTSSSGKNTPTTSDATQQ